MLSVDMKVLPLGHGKAINQWMMLLSLYLSSDEPSLLLQMTLVDIMVMKIYVELIVTGLLTHSNLLGNFWKKKKKVSQNKGR